MTLGRVQKLSRLILVCSELTEYYIGVKRDTWQVECIIVGVCERSVGGVAIMGTSTQIRSGLPSLI
jgi:hypothetical protein